MKKKDLILNPYFIIGLSVLLLNDFYLKAAYGNFVTGKLSDFAGLPIFSCWRIIQYQAAERFGHTRRKNYQERRKTK